MRETWKLFYGRGMKTVIAVITLACVFLSSSPVMVNAAAKTSVTASSCMAERGAAASVTVSLKGNPGIWGLKLRIRYDHSALTLKSVAAGKVFSMDEMVMSDKRSRDPYVIVASGNTLKNKTKDGTLVTLNFAAKSKAAYKAYPVTVEVAEAVNVSGKTVSISAKSGSVTVKKTPKKMKLSSVKCAKNTKKITGKVSASKATVKIKVGKGAYKKATVKGKSFSIKLGQKLKKKTKVYIKVTKKGYKSISKVYQVK